jgi:hypothetical protein
MDCTGVKHGRPTVDTLHTYVPVEIKAIYQTQTVCYGWKHVQAMTMYRPGLKAENNIHITSVWNKSHPMFVHTSFPDNFYLKAYNLPCLCRVRDLVQKSTKHMMAKLLSVCLTFKNLEIKNFLINNKCFANTLLQSFRESRF